MDGGEHETGRVERASATHELPVRRVEERPRINLDRLPLQACRDDHPLVVEDLRVHDHRHLYERRHRRACPEFERWEVRSDLRLTGKLDVAVTDRVSHQAEIQTPVGLLSFGRMPSHWGLGVLTNSGSGIEAPEPVEEPFWQPAADGLADFFADPTLGGKLHLTYRAEYQAQFFRFHGYRFKVLRKARNRLTQLRVAPIRTAAPDLEAGGG